MNSELKEGEEIKGKDEFGNEFIEKRIGRVVERRYLGNSIKGKNHIIETRQIEKKAPDIFVEANKIDGEGFMVVINVVMGDKEKGGNWMVSKDFARDSKEQEKLEKELRKYFGKELVASEIYPIVMNVKDKIAELENKEKGEAYPSGAVEKKPSKYIVVGVDENGKPIKKEWSEFEKEVLEEHKGYNLVRREV